MHLYVLASGSKGNAAVIEGPQGSVLVDCGLTGKMLAERADEVGCDLSRVQAILVTHEHADHISGLPVALRRLQASLFATAGTVCGRRQLSELPFTLIDHDMCLDLCGMSIQAFPTSHDVGDPMCFRFEVRTPWEEEGGGELVDAIGWMSDTGIVTEEARRALHGVRILAIEANHDLHMLETGRYPGFLKARVKGNFGHLSNAQCAEATVGLVTDDTECVVALHLSEENNRPSLAVRAIAEALGADAANATFTEARTPDGRLSVCAAAQHHAIKVW